MPIAAADLHQRLSGGATNAVPAASLGGAKSATAVPAGLFDAIAGTESTAGDIEYRCAYVHNNHGSLTLTGAVAWISASALGAGHAIAIGVGSSAVNGIEQTVANESTAPTGVTFSAPTTRATGLVLGDIPAGQHRAIWERRTVGAASAASSNSYTVDFGGDTLA